MKKKITTYAEVEISKELREKVVEYLKDNPITHYWDRNDGLTLEQINMLMKDKNAVEDDIWENNIDYICDLECEQIKEVQNQFSELADFEVSELREEFLDYLSVDLNIEQLIRITSSPRVRIEINSNYEGCGWQGREGDREFKNDEYVKQIRKLLKGKYDEKSFQDELDNMCSSCNKLIFYFKCPIENLIGINEEFKKEITIPKGAWAGFYDSWNGSGSVLEIKLLEDVTIKKVNGKTEYDNVKILLDELKGNGYSVEKTYGLCNVPEINIKVK